MGLRIDQNACDTFWQAYCASLPSEHAHRLRLSRPEAFGFCAEHPELVEELAQLVVSGRKRATTSLAIEHTILGEELPKPGDLSIVVGRDGSPSALIELTHVENVPFDKVDAEYAAIEGEGDATLETWRRDHIWYFTELSKRLGVEFDGTTPVVCQIFQMVWPAMHSPTS
ncbi:MAG TPA: ASCH domain-containing protein [Polyangiales bacterium]|nr:ASCH domain-containing protein [Polyangiales bacterium]